MPRNLFLSFLGTNDYVECTYFPEWRPEQAASNVKYVQEALLPLFCSHFTEDDAHIFFLTDLARQTNWENDGQWNRDTRAYDKPNTGLADRLKKLPLKGKIVDVPVPEGFSSQEIWVIFERIFDQIQEGDRIFFDITHAFRSLPLLNLALVNYAKALRHIRVEGIFYGAFEKLGPAEKVRQMPVEERRAPILDLLSISELQDWAAAARDFVSYGNPARWNALASASIKPLMIATKGQDASARNLNGISRNIEELVPLIQANRGQALQNFRFELLEQYLDNFSADQNLLKPLNPIIGLVKTKIAPFFGRERTRWLVGVQWCIRHGLIQQGLTQLQEGLLTWLCGYFEGQGIAPAGYFDYTKEEPRALLSSALSFLPNPPPEAQWTNAIGRSPEIGAQVMQTPLIQALAPLYQRLGPLRNDMSHGGYTRYGKPGDFAKNLEALYQAILPLVETEEAPLAPPQPSEGLINLSNHPSDRWSPEQLQAVQQLYGSVEDLPFPAIPPEWDERDIEALAAQYLEQIRPRRPAAVHVMGEMTFTYALAQKLRDAGIPCVASTSERQVIDHGDGRKEAIFRFVRFRPYH